MESEPERDSEEGREGETQRKIKLGRLREVEADSDEKLSPKRWMENKAETGEGGSKQPRI